MSEKQIPSVEKEDIQAPRLVPGSSAIIFQRHERYQRERNAVDAGSIFPEHAESAQQRDLEFFRDIIAHDDEGTSMFFFASSDTQYADNGRRSMETAQLAFDAAVKALEEANIDPAERIINLNPNFSTSRFEATNQDVRPIEGIREPQMFEDSPDYVEHLRTKYGEEDGPGTGISQKAWAAHEEDLEKATREELGAEGVYDILGRTKKSLKVLERYSKVFHANNPDSRLVIWAASHYDTISPLVKDTTETGFGEYVPVDYGAGVVIEVPPEGETTLNTSNATIAIELGNKALSA